MNYFGKNIKINFFGETSSPYFGLTIDGIKPGIAINIDKINNALQMYEPSTISWKFSTGYINGYTTGAPVTIIIDNEDPIIKFKNGIICPSTSDLVIKDKYKGFNDFIDEGHLSTKSTYLFIILGEICKQILKDQCIIIITRIKSIKDITDKTLKFAEINVGNLSHLLSSDFPVLDDRAKHAMNQVIKKAKEIKDTVGGILQTFIFNVPKSLGEPFFDGFSSILSHLLFSFPYIKGIEFGDGLELSSKYGSKTIDEIVYKNGNIVYLSNHQGGIDSGITNGNPIIFQTMVRPSPKMPRILNSIDTLSKQNIEISNVSNYKVTDIFLTLKLINSLSYYILLDLIIENNKNGGIIRWKYLSLMVQT